MKPIIFPGANLVLNKPADMTDEQCSPLHVQKVTSQGFPYYISAWQPSEEDIAAINQGRPVFLQITGAAHPPVSLFTLTEKGEHHEHR